MHTYMYMHVCIFKKRTKRACWKGESIRDNKEAEVVAQDEVVCGGGLVVVDWEEEDLLQQS